MMKRSISMLLLIAMLAGMTACGESGGNEVTDTTAGDTTTAEPVETGIPEPELPVKDYGGEEFTFLSRGRTSYSYMERYLIAEEENGEVVNDAVFERNMAVEEKFNVKLNFIENNDQTEITQLRSIVLAGDDGVDVISARRSDLGALATEGFLVDFNSLPYVNLTTEYWDANAVEHLTILGKLYMMPSDISMGNLSMARFMYFNKGILEDYKMESPYDLVDSNKWTLDKMLSMTTMVSEDVNGDGVFNWDDKYGFLFDASSNGTIGSLCAGVGLRTVATDDEEVLVCNIMTERIQDVLTKCYSVFTDTDYALSSEELKGVGDCSNYAHEYNYGRALFAQGHFLFYNSGISSMSQFRDMEQDFGVVPNPKFDENQDGYYHKIDKFALIFGVPVCTADTERVGSVMEYMSWYSNKTVLPAYYDTTILSKRLRDDRDVEMLNIVKNSMLYDFADLYNLGGDVILWNGYLSESLASTYASESTALLTKMENLIETFQSLE